MKATKDNPVYIFEALIKPAIQTTHPNGIVNKSNFVVTDGRNEDDAIRRIKKRFKRNGIDVEVVKLHPWIKQDGEKATYLEGQSLWDEAIDITCYPLEYERNTRGRDLRYEVAVK